MNVNPIPTGYRTVTPYLAVPAVEELIAFLKVAFGAEEIDRSALPDGTILNAELKVGDSMIMLGGTPPGKTSFHSMLYLYVKDVDSMFKQAVKAGGKVVIEVTNQPYGDRVGGVEDACGNQWWVATRKENLSGEEIGKRMAQQKR